MANPKLLTELDGLISDVNVNEIADHIKCGNLDEWCDAWRKTAKRIVDCIDLEGETE